MTTPMSEQQARRGRPSKGERQRVSARLAMPRYEEFWAHVRQRGLSNGNDLAEQIFVEWLEKHRDELSQQDHLPQQQMIDLEERRIA